jgi:hypothetical protein
MRPRCAGVALAAPLLLLAAACGSQQAGVFHPTGVMAAAKPAASAAAPAALVPFPGKVQFEFDALPSNPAQAALVSRDRAFILAYYYAIYTRGRNTSYQSYVDWHFGTTVTQPPSLPGDLDVNYCVDEAGLQYTDIRTGQSLGNGSPQGELYYYESDTFARSHSSWNLVGTLVTPYPTGQAKECKP